MWRSLRAVTAVAGVAAGATILMAFFSAAGRLETQFHHDIKPAALPMMLLFVEAESPVDENTNEGTLAALAAAPDVEVVEGRLIDTVYWQTAADDPFRSAPIYAYSVPFEALQIEPPRLLSGRFPATGNNEIAVERQLAERFGWKIGMSLNFRLINAVVQNPATIRATQTVPVTPWTISGIASHPYLNDNTGAFYAHYEDAITLSGAFGYSQFALRYRDFGGAVRHFDPIRDLINQYSDYRYFGHVLQSPHYAPPIQQAQQRFATWRVVGVIGMGVTSLVTVLLFYLAALLHENRSSVLEKRESSRRRIFVVQWRSSFFCVGGGAFIGIMLGIPAGAWLARRFAPQLGLGAESRQLAAGVVIEGIIWIVAMPSLLLFLLAWRTAYPTPKTRKTHLYRRGLRWLLGGIWLWLASALWIATTAFAQTYPEASRSVYRLFNYHLSLEIRAADLPTAEVQALLQNKLASDADLFAAFDANIEFILEDSLPLSDRDNRRSVFMSALDPAGDSFRFHLREGRVWEQHEDGIIITARVASILQKDIGDRVQVLYRGQRGEFRIIGVEGFPFDMAFLNLNTARFGDTPLRPDEVRLRFRDKTPSPAEIDRHAETLRAWLLQNGVVVESQNRVALNEASHSSTQGLQTFLRRVAVLLAFFGALTLCVTFTLNAVESPSERRDGQWAHFRRQMAGALVVGFIIWGSSLPFAYWLFKILQEFLALGRFPFVFQWQTAWQALPFVLILSGAARLLPTWWIVRQH